MNSSLNLGIVNSIFFFFFFFFFLSNTIFKNSRDSTFNHQINMILTKSICKYRQICVLVALLFVRKHARWWGKSLTLVKLVLMKNLKSVINKTIHERLIRVIVDFLALML